MRRIRHAFRLSKFFGITIIVLLEAMVGGYGIISVKAMELPGGAPDEHLASK